MSLPWDLSDPIEPVEPVMVVDLRRCTGCHACAVACKVEHAVPLGEFRVRVRWMARPEDGTMAFLPLFDAATCDYGANRRSVGMQPACVAACPTAALIFADAAEQGGAVDAAIDSGGRTLDRTGDARGDVLYRGLEGWQEDKMNAGVALHPDDEDITYEQGQGQGRGA